MTDRPDVMVIDGGKGHLSVALEVLKHHKIDDIRVIAVAKGADRNAGHETFFMGDKEQVELQYEDPLRYYLQNLRDEAHRFAIATYRKLHRKQILTSKISSIPGVGVKRQKSLLVAFGSWQGVMEANLEDLQQVQDIGKNMALNIYSYLHGSKHI
jgi:excinuclease ABC subunit C